VPGFEGLKLSGDRAVLRRNWGVEAIDLVRSSDLIQTVRPGRVGWGGNSGFHMLNLAVQLKPKKIILVGFDMRIDLGLHWHGAHEGLNNPVQRNVDRWRRVIDHAAGTIAAMGIPVINASPNSALVNFPKMGLMEAMAC